MTYYVRHVLSTRSWKTDLDPKIMLVKSSKTFQEVYFSFNIASGPVLMCQESFTCLWAVWDLEGPRP